LIRHETRLLEIELVLEEAQAARESGERDRLAEVLAEGEALLRREWPSLVDDLRAVQRKIQAFSLQLAVLDGRLGRQHFQWVAWGAMLPDSLLDYWLRATAAAYGLSLEE
jgi:hypothetical protein